MKAKEITAEDRERWKKNGYFPVVCRLCDDVMLYPLPTYKPERSIEIAPTIIEADGGDAQ